MIRNTIVPPSLSGSVFSNFTYKKFIYYLKYEQTDT